jgi:glucosamine--fructose-6-phosphate aminotransferase (isomerizing)
VDALVSRLAAEMAEQPGALSRVLEANPVLGALRAELATRRRVVFVGIGSSRHVASYGVACFEALSAVPATLLPAPGAGVPLPVLTADDAVVIVSQSGSTPALVPVVEIACAASALVVSVTNSEGSPLEARAHVALHAGAGAERVVPATKSVTASMLLVRALAGPVREEELIAPVDEALRADWQVGDVAEVVVAAGFAAEAVSDEVALKLAEVTGRLAVAETVVDYLHGPAAVPARVLALLAADDPNSTALEARPDVLAIRCPELQDPSLEAVLRVVIGQCLALRWAERLGVDPDDARGLAKVTLTL